MVYISYRKESYVEDVLLLVDLLAFLVLNQIEFVLLLLTVLVLLV